MVKVEVGQHDVAHVLAPETQCLDLPYSCLPFAQLDVEKAAIETRNACRRRVRVIDVLQAKASVDQDQPMRVGFDQKAMANQLAGGSDRPAVEQCSAPGAEGGAVEMVNAHEEISACPGFAERNVKP
jgi:hypothetical protein